MCVHQNYSYEILIDMDIEALVQFMCHCKESKRFYSWDSLFSFLYWGWLFIETGHYKICGFQIEFYFNFCLNVIRKNKLHRWKRHPYKNKSHHNISMGALTLNQSPDIRQTLNFGYIKFIDIKQINCSCKYFYFASFLRSKTKFIIKN